MNTINVFIHEITQYDIESIRQVFHSDSSILSYAKRKVEVMGHTKLKLQKEINNLKFSDTYEANVPMYRPPFCPTETCPYYQTHPVTLQKKMGKKSELEEAIESYQIQIRDLDTEIYRYADYSVIYTMIKTLRQYWKKAQPVLASIQALQCNDLLQILTNRQSQVWYSYDRVVQTIERLEKRDQMYALNEQIKKIKNELAELEILTDTSVEKEIAHLEEQKATLEWSIEEIGKRIVEETEELKSYNQMYVDLSEKSIKEDALFDKKRTLEVLTERIAQMEINRQKILDNQNRIETLDKKLTEKASTLRDRMGELDQLQTKLNDIHYTNKELDTVMEQQKYMTYMVDAVSSKKGIPLKIIELFLDSCRDTINDMIYQVFEDDFEILKFHITDTEFKIPYIYNGRKIDDIAKASQGQSSIVSTAISFALMIQTGMTDYNIPLLDEMDAPLHKPDKTKFIVIIMDYLNRIHSRQCFVITHDNNTFDGYPVQVISTTDEIIDPEKYEHIIYV